MEEKQWFIYVVDHHEGPYTLSEVKNLIGNGQAKKSSFAWKDGMADWIMMSDIAEFGDAKESGEGHGPFGFLTGSSKKSSSDVTREPALGSPGTDAAATGVDLGGTSPSASVWCLSSNKSFSGPHSLKTILRKLESGEVKTIDQIWRDGWTHFTTIAEIPELMRQLSPEILEGGGKKKKEKSSALALGLGGGASTRSYRWYRSTKFILFSFLLIALGVYQGLATGGLDALLKPAGLSERVKALGLQPLAIRPEVITTITTGASNLAGPVIAIIAPKLPEPIRTWLSTVPLPEDLDPKDASFLRETALTPLKNGTRFAIALPAGDVFNPSFVIASNLANGTVLSVTVRGKPGTLLNAVVFEKIFSTPINDHIARTPKLTFEDGKPMPRGEYEVIASDALVQSGQATQAFFLGGKRDALYENRLREFNKRVNERLTQELAEIDQVTATIEGMANESATKFFALSNGLISKDKKREWNQYHLKYLKIATQVQGILSKATPALLKKDYALPEHYEKVKAAFQLSQDLHLAENDFVIKGGKMDDIRAKAGATAAKLMEIRNGISQFSHR